MQKITIIGILGSIIITLIILILVLLGVLPPIFFVFLFLPFVSVTKNKTFEEYRYRTCPNCGYPLTGLENYCPNCGYKLR